MIETRGVERERLWKSYVLASLFCEVHHRIENNTQLDSKSAMYDIAKRQRLALMGGMIRSGLLQGEHASYVVRSNITLILAYEVTLPSSFASFVLLTSF
jgi:hypothetical protein